MEHVRSKLKHYRQTRGLSQSQLAELVGINRQTIIAMESEDGGDPRVSTARRLLAYFDIAFEDLYPDIKDA